MHCLSKYLYYFCSQGVFPPSSFDELNLKGWWYGAVEYQVKTHLCEMYLHQTDTTIGVSLQSFLIALVLKAVLRPPM